MFKERASKGIDRVCIKPISEKLNTHFKSGGSIREAWGNRAEFRQVLDAQAIDPRNKSLHALAGTGLALGAITVYEAYRANHSGLPSSAEVVAAAVPGLSLTQINIYDSAKLQAQQGQSDVSGADKRRYISDTPATKFLYVYTGEVSKDGRPFIVARGSSGIPQDVSPDKAAQLTGQVFHRGNSRINK